jgi:hypothetical protein
MDTAAQAADPAAVVLMINFASRYACVRKGTYNDPFSLTSSVCGASAAAGSCKLLLQACCCSTAACTAVLPS